MLDQFLVTRSRRRPMQPFARQVEEIESSVANVESESMLEDQIRVLRELAPRAGVSAEKLHRAVETIEIRISEIAAKVDAASPPDVSGPSLIEREIFDDEALRNLFAPLIEQSMQQADSKTITVGRR